MRPTPTPFSKMLLARMEEEGLTNVQVGALLGVDASRVSRYLAGDLPGMDKIPVCAKFLRIGESEMLEILYSQRNAPKVNARRRMDELEEAVRKLEERVAQLEGPKKPTRKRR